MSEQRIPVARDVFVDRRGPAAEPIRVTITRVRPPVLWFRDEEGGKTKITIERFVSRAELVHVSPIALRGEESDT